MYFVCYVIPYIYIIQKTEATRLACTINRIVQRRIIDTFFTLQITQNNNNNNIGIAAIEELYKVSLVYIYIYNGKAKTTVGFLFAHIMCTYTKLIYYVFYI